MNYLSHVTYSYMYLYSFDYHSCNHLNTYLVIPPLIVS